MGIIIICLPLAHDLSPAHLLGICAGLTGFLVLEETYGKLHRGEALAKPNGTEQDVIDAREGKDTGSTEGDTSVKELKAQ